tara:strand:- start:267 stop:1109 length:843 start_codon:yes stop_codon:yes gene_type:complete
MVPQHQHKVMTSFLLWFDNHLLTKGEAFSNKTGAFYYFDDSRLPSSFKAYSSPYKQWVNDSSISGANIPSSFMGSGRADNIIFDFENGRIVETGGAFANDETLTGTFAVKDFNIYLTNETEEDLILESKFVKNSRYGDSESGIKPYDQAVPAIFINSENVTNVPLAFGGEDETKITIKAVVLAEDAYGLDGVLSIFADTRHKEITMIPFGAHPSTEYGDLKDGSYNYTGLNSTYKGNELPMYIEDVVVSKLSDKAQKLSIGDLKVGFIDFDVSQYRFPRQ